MGFVLFTFGFVLLMVITYILEDKYGKDIGALSALFLLILLIVLIICFIPALEHLT